MYKYHRGRSFMWVLVQWCIRIAPLLKGACQADLILLVFSFRIILNRDPTHFFLSFTVFVPKRVQILQTCDNIVLNSFSSETQHCRLFILVHVYFLHSLSWQKTLSAFIMKSFSLKDNGSKDIKALIYIYPCTIK